MMNHGRIRRLVAGAVSACLLSAGSISPAADAKTAPKATWTPLFNGKNLQGWTVHYASKTADGAPPPASIFMVENGAIHAYPTQAAGSEQPNAYLETQAEYRDYVISLEYQWGEKKFAPRLDLVR